MKRFKYFALAALVAFGACDEGGDPVDVDPITGTVTASVTADGAGVAGVTVNLVGPTSASQTTPASGQVTFANVEEGAYAVTISGVPSGFVCSNTSQTVTISTAGQTANASFSCSVVRSASISGQVTSNGQGVEGATIAISGPDGTETTQTGSAGTYQFTGLIAGNYTVTLQQATLGGIECVETAVTRNLEPGESEVANFSCGGQATPASVFIERITDQAGNAVDRTDVRDIIVIQVGVEEGGQDVDSLKVFLINDDLGEGGTKIQLCSQDLDLSAVSGPMAVDEEFEVDCVVNTAAIRDIDGVVPTQFRNGANTANPFQPIFLNDEWRVQAEAYVDGGETATAATNITLANFDVLALNVENDNPEAADFLIEQTTGLRWLSGSLTFTVYPIIYSAPFDPNDPVIARTNFGFDSYVSTESTGHFTNDIDSRPLVGANAQPASWSLSDQTPDAGNGSFEFALSDSNLDNAPLGPTTNGVLQLGNGDGVRDLITGSIGAQNIRISTITSFGQFGPGVICTNISTTCTPTAGTNSPNPLRVFYQGVLQSGTGAVNNVLRVDNQEPWVNVIELDPHPLATMFPVPASAITTNGKTAIRGGFNFNGQRDGWLNHAYEFDAGMWASAGATDAPNFYATHPNFTLPTGITAGTTRLAGIGVDASSLGYFAMASAATNSPSAFTITGIGNAAQRLRFADGTSVSTGADYPHKVGPGLDDPSLTPPNSNRADDVSLVAIVADLFANAGFSNILETGVDSNPPEFRNQAGGTGTDPLYPTEAGTVYNTYGNLQASNPSNIDEATLNCVGTAPNQTCTYDKTPGVFAGTITDAGNGFSGAAGVAMSDWENGCPAGTLACAGSFRNERTGVRLQLAAGLPASNLLGWEWSLAGSNFSSPTGAAIAAYDAAVAAPAAHDGYRMQQPTAYDRAANLSTIDPTEEHIADKTRPDVGNVEMPTVPMFTLGQSYTYRGEAQDRVDLRYTDFAIDFNTITTIQAYADEAVPGPFAPGVDAYGNPYVANHGGVIENTGNSLQLPLRDTHHTAFGSASILLHTDLTATAEFIGCVALFDEGGAPVVNPGHVHIPRGPRWRTNGHEYPEVPGGEPPETYGLINTQFNTFTPSSVPQNNQTTCANGMTANQIRAQVDPDGTIAEWNLSVTTTGTGTSASTSLQISVSGQSGTFVPSFDITDIDLYYIDVEGRARILDTSGTNFSGPFVEDEGTGATGRTYTWTYAGALPENTLTPTGHATPFFFTVRFDNGTAIMWDDSANP